MYALIYVINVSNTLNCEQLLDGAFYHILLFSASLWSLNPLNEKYMNYRLVKPRRKNGVHKDFIYQVVLTC